MSKKRLKKLDKEDKKLVDELLKDEEITLQKFLGFRLPKARCFVPPVQCGYTAAPVMSLVPMYDVVLLPIYPFYLRDTRTSEGSSKISKVSVFKKQHGLTPSELVILAEKGQVMPYFPYDYVEYSEKIINPLLQPGVPRITPSQMAVIRSVPIRLLMKEKTGLICIVWPVKKARNSIFQKAIAALTVFPHAT